MNLLITGGAGYIGSHTADQFLKLGHKVVIIDNLSTGFKEALPEKAHFIFGDVRETDLILKILNDHDIDTIIHFAAKLIVPESVEKPTEYYENNIGGLVSILKALDLIKKNVSGVNQIKKRHLVFSSTAAVYGNFNEARPITEEDPVAPINPYGQSKLMCEQILKDYAYANSFFSYVVLRYFNVAGASDSGLNGQRSKNATHLIKVACEVATKKREVIHVFGTDYKTSDGTGVRDYIHVEDLALAHIMAAGYLQHGGASDTFNCGYGSGASVLEVLSSVEKAAGFKINFQKAERRAGDPASLVANAQKIKEKLKWQPQRQSLDLICKSALAWEKKIELF